MRPEKRTPDQTYSMVKSFVIRGNLLSHQTLEGLAESKNLEEMVVKLRGTVYTDSVSKLSQPYDIQQMERAFKEHLANIHQALLKVAPKGALLSAYYLKHIAGDLKTLLKGKAQKIPDEELSKHIDMYMEELVGRRDLIARALSAEDLDQTVKALEDTEFGSEAEAALAIYKETGRLQIFDVYIDKAFYRRVVDAYLSQNKNEERVKDIVAVDVDGYNVLAVLRGRLWELDPAQIRSLLITPAFDVTEGDLRKMIDAESISEAVKILNGTPYRSIVPEGDVDEIAIAKLEDGFRLLSYHRAFDPFLWDIHQVSIAIGAVKLSELEVRNLSAIAFGVQQHLSVKEIMSQLVFPK
ncbi:MAG: V-type ATPase subunit [Thaumarchaeota archaeon]|nr:V-type ATPase subunit [Nitrososphaerota archaeon]